MPWSTWISRTCIASLLWTMAACGQSHSETQSGGDFRDFDAGAATPSDDRTSSASIDQTDCPIGEIAPGIAELEIYSDSLGGELPVTFSAHCGHRNTPLELMATDGLSTFSLAAAAPGQGDMGAEGSFEFEDLALFAGHCNVCLGVRAGTLSCPSLIWKTGEDLVKASVSGSFRCDPAE